MIGKSITHSEFHIRLHGKVKNGSFARFPHSDWTVVKSHLRTSLALIVFLCALTCGPSGANAVGGFNSTSEAWITEHPSSQWWSLSTALTGDVDGDGRTDAIADVFGTWNVALSTGSKFAPSTPWLSTFAAPSPDITPLVGDVNGDGKDDAVAAENNGVWKVALANSGGTQFNAPSVTPFVTGFGSPVSGSTFTYMLGDVNGDKKADAVYFEKNYSQAKGTWSVALSNGTGFVPAAAPWATGVGSGYSGTTVAKLADVTGDGRSDAVYIENGKWTAAPSTGAKFGYSASPTSLLSSTLGTSNPLLADVNGDGKADGLSVSTNGAWTVALASTAPGASGDIPSFAAPVNWGKGAQAPTSGVTSGATPPPTQYFAVDLDGTVPSGAAKGTAESLAVKGGTWWVWAAKTPADFKASGPPALDENFNSLDSNRWSTAHYDYWYNGQPTRGQGVNVPYSIAEAGTYSAANSTTNGVLNQSIGVTGAGTSAVYTIGSINSLGRIEANGQYAAGTGFRFKEGYVEASINVPRSIDCGGCWPAFWLLPAPSISAKTGLTEVWEHQCRSKPEEVDIFEFFPHLPGDWKDIQYYDTHWGTCTPNGYLDTTVRNNLDTAPAQTRQVVSTKLTGGYHTYGMLRTGTKLQFFVDGIAGQEVTVGIPKKEMYLILTLQRGKDNTPPTNMTFPPTTSGVKMQTDYIKVWR